MAESEIDTIIFVDVDGVLNVGAADPGQCPILFNEANNQAAIRVIESGMAASSCNPMKRLLALRERELAPCNGENTTYEHLVAGTHDALSPVLLDNFVELVKNAGNNCSFVLSSTWRKPNYVARVQLLEEMVSQRLGRLFKFDERTPICDERTAADRLQVMGAYLENIRRTRPKRAPRMRVIVLEDFCSTALNGWKVDGLSMWSREDVEGYLWNRAAGPGLASVLLVHTYENWRTPSDLYVEIGMGFQRQHVEEAIRFLKGEVSGCDENTKLDKMDGLVRQRSTSSTASLVVDKIKANTSERVQRAFNKFRPSEWVRRTST